MNPNVPVARIEVGAFRRDGVEILQGVRWTIDPGQHWAILGPNGSGKTSLARILGAYEWPSEGTVEVLGDRFGRTDLRELRKRIGIVSSTLGLRFPEWDDARAIVLSGLEAAIGRNRIFTVAEAERAVSTLGSVGAGHLAGRAFGVLSQGERQRVLIARALVPRPALLVLDEPCEGLDPVARERFLEDLGKLCTMPEGPSMVLITHHLEEIPRFVTHALLLSEGKPLAAGAIAEVLTDENLTRAYGVPCEVRVEAPGRYGLRVRIQ
ncbi:MAG TPA: ABC transporter ATP-binding protein [Myxococcales bacterium]|nr:ABC transporter ATP-binding protein [Myxococcales bacterium]